jgi:hypothetical protein
MMLERSSCDGNRGVVLVFCFETLPSWHGATQRSKPQRGGGANNMNGLTQCRIAQPL